MIVIWVQVKGRERAGTKVCHRLVKCLRDRLLSTDYPRVLVADVHLLVCFVLLAYSMI